MRTARIVIPKKRSSFQLKNSLQYFKKAPIIFSLLNMKERKKMEESEFKDHRLL